MKLGNRLASSNLALAQQRLSFWRNAHGSVAVEFAFLLPLMALMLLGTIEIARAVNVDRHFTAATNATGDLIAQEAYLGTNESNAVANLNGVMRSIAHLMQPYDAQDMKLAVFMVQASHTDANDTRVQWSYSHNGMPKPSKCQSYQLPANLIDKGGFVIVVESSYSFRPLFADFVPGFSSAMNWSEKSFHIPRKGCVAYVNGSNRCVSSC